jgi:hypothetical protein
MRGGRRNESDIQLKGDLDDNSGSRMISDRRGASSPRENVGAWSEILVYHRVLGMVLDVQAESRMSPRSPLASTLGIRLEIYLDN